MFFLIGGVQPKTVIWVRLKEFAPPVDWLKPG